MFITEVEHCYVQQTFLAICMNLLSIIFVHNLLHLFHLILKYKYCTFYTFTFLKRLQSKDVNWATYFVRLTSLSADLLSMSPTCIKDEGFVLFKC